MKHRSWFSSIVGLPEPRQRAATALPYLSEHDRACGLPDGSCSTCGYHVCSCPEWDRVALIEALTQTNSVMRGKRGAAPGKRGVVRRCATDVGIGDDGGNDCWDGRPSGVVRRLETAPKAPDGWTRRMEAGDRIVFARAFDFGVEAVVWKHPHSCWHYCATCPDDRGAKAGKPSDGVVFAFIDAEAEALSLVERLHPEPRPGLVCQCGANSWRDCDASAAVECKACGARVGYRDVLRAAGHG